MEKIIRIKNLIEEALATHTGFEPYFLPSSNAWSDMPKILKPSEELKTAAAEYLIDFQREFIEARRRADNSLAFLKKELERIEGLFFLPTYSVEFPVRVRDGKTQEELRIEKETFYYDFDAIEADLPQGRIKGESQHGVICYLLATANFYLWLKELADEAQIEQPTPAQGKRLIWNGAKNALAYILYQLKNEHFTDERKPILEASNEDLAEFLKVNFECFKDDKITSIMALFENREKHPQKDKNRFVISRGNPPKD